MSIKKWPILWEFSQQILLESDWFCADLTEKRQQFTNVFGKSGVLAYICYSLCNHVKIIIPFMNKNNGTFLLFLISYIL